MCTTNTMILHLFVTIDHDPHYEWRRLGTPQRTQSWARQQILGWPLESSPESVAIETLLMPTSLYRCQAQKCWHLEKIYVQDVTSVIDLISPLESNEEGDHHSVTVTTRWDMKFYFAKSQCGEIKTSRNEHKSWFSSTIGRLQELGNAKTPPFMERKVWWWTFRGLSKIAERSSILQPSQVPRYYSYHHDCHYRHFLYLHHGYDLHCHIVQGLLVNRVRGFSTQTRDFSTSSLAATSSRIRRGEFVTDRRSLATSAWEAKEYDRVRLSNTHFVAFSVSLKNQIFSKWVRNL